MGGWGELHPICLGFFGICLTLQSPKSYSESDILSVTHVLGYNSATFGSVLHTILSLKNKDNFFLLQKKPIDTEVWK